MSISTILTGKLPKLPITQPLTFLEELAGTPKPDAIRRDVRYSCYLLPQDQIGPLGAHISMVSGAIMRHRYMFREMPHDAFVSHRFFEKFANDLAQVTGQLINGEEMYGYRFVLGPIEQLVYVHPGTSLMPESLGEIKSIGLPNNTVICTHP